MKNMKAQRQIKITVNTRQFGYEKNRQQIIVWLHNMIPIIMQERKVVTEKIFLHATNQRISFCLS
jgi:hypothetical protein